MKEPVPTDQKDAPAKPAPHPLVQEQRLKTNAGYWHNGRRIHTRTPNRRMSR